MAHTKSPQEWTVEDNVAYIYIVRRSGEKVKVLASPDDVDRLCDYRWAICGKGAVWTAWAGPGHRSMHSIVMGEKMIDHINRNPKDNRRENLRPCTHRQNLRNKGKYSLQKAGGVPYKGVFYRRDKTANKYRVKIKMPDYSAEIGNFRTAEEAAIAYDLAAEILYGDFACTNRSLGLI